MTTAGLLRLKEIHNEFLDLELPKLKTYSGEDDNLWIDTQFQNV